MNTNFSTIEPLEARIAPAQIIVGNLLDAGPGSLRQAILDANATVGAADEIIFQKMSAGKTLPLTGVINFASDLPAITDALKITGPVAGKSTGIKINGHKHALFSITGGDVTMTDLTIMNGQSHEGGGIFIDDATHTIVLTDLTITGNHATATAPGQDSYGGGIDIVNGSVTISNSKISGNFSTGFASDGLHKGSSANGAGIFCQGTLTLDHSTISGNVAQGGTALPANAGAFGGDAFGGGVDCSTANGNVTIKATTISGNKVLGGKGTPGGPFGANSGRGDGGGVNNDGGTVNITTGSTISGNIGKGSSGVKGSNGVPDASGGFAIGGGICSSGGAASMTIQNSTVSGNTATPGKGVVGGLPGVAAGGGLYSSEMLDVFQVTFSKNSGGDEGGGVALGGHSKATIEASTFSGNKAKLGGGVMINSGAVVIKNSTIADNSAAIGGGGFLIAGGTVKIHNSTIAQNSAGSGGGFEIFNTTTPVEIISTIIAGNKAKTDADLSSSGFGPVVSFSLIQQVTAGSELNNTSHDNLVNMDPLLGKLTNHGGPTFTILPKTGSRVIAKGSNPDMLTTDQRGIGFPRIVGSDVDIGAVEVM